MYAKYTWSELQPRIGFLRTLPMATMTENAENGSCNVFYYSTACKCALVYYVIRLLLTTL